jgi:hypothetical protein
MRCAVDAEDSRSNGRRRDPEARADRIGGVSALRELVAASVPLDDPRADRDPHGAYLRAVLDLAIAERDFDRVWRVLDEREQLDQKRRLAPWTASTS